MRLLRLPSSVTVLILFFPLLAGCLSTGDINTGPGDVSISEPSSSPSQSAPTSDPESAPQPDSEEQEEPESPGGEEKTDYRNGDASYIFDQDRLHIFELTLSEENLAFLDEAPGREEYVEGTLTFKGQTIGPIGIRYKGSVGAWVFCLSGSFFEGEGAKTCTKLSMKVKINWEDSDDTFYGLKKLQFHSQNLDPTKMHERLGYWLFREMGVPAPRSVHAKLIINGKYNGIFALTEQIDGRFTRENFEDGTGNLYKEVWPIHPDGRPKTDSDFRWALKTNEGEDPSFDLVRSFGEEIVAAEKQNRQSVMETWVDMDQILAYAIVDRAISNDDGVFHWYCGGPSGISDGDRDAQNEGVGEYACNPHNYYWYGNPTTETMHLIPWDLDNAFEVIRVQSNPVIPIKDAWGETTNDCRPFIYGGWGIAQRSAACDLIISTWAAYEDEYESMLREFLDGPFSKEIVEERLYTWADQIEDAMAEADVAHDDQPSVTEWYKSLDQLIGDLEYARNKFNDQ